MSRERGFSIPEKTEKDLQGLLSSFGAGLGSGGGLLRIHLKRRKKFVFEEFLFGFRELDREGKLKREVGPLTQEGSPEKIGTKIIVCERGGEHKGGEMAPVR